jgi:hypothetical protein
MRLKGERPMKILLQGLELLGLLIAAFDFFEISPRIQTWIDNKRYKYFVWLDDKGNEKFAYSNPIVGLLSLASAVLLVWFCYAAWTHAANALPLLGWFFVVGVGPFVLLFVLIPLLYNLLLIINRSRSKTVGSVAFGLALLSWGLQRWWQYVHPCV